jgi:DNA-binding NarL/FixJ family response regulator
MGADSPLVGLADRELATLALIADGLSNEAIAGRLHVSVRTVEAVCATIFRKLDLAEQPETNRRVRAAVPGTKESDVRSRYVPLRSTRVAM